MALRSVPVSTVQRAVNRFETYDIDVDGLWGVNTRYAIHDLWGAAIRRYEAGPSALDPMFEELAAEAQRCPGSGWTGCHLFPNGEYGIRWSNWPNRTREIQLPSLMVDALERLANGEVSLIETAFAQPVIDPPLVADAVDLGPPIFTDSLPADTGAPPVQAAANWESLLATLTAPTGARPAVPQTGGGIPDWLTVALGIGGLAVGGAAAWAILKWRR